MRRRLSGVKLKPSRMVNIGIGVTSKLKSSGATLDMVKEEILVLGRMLRAYGLGKYTHMPWKTVVLVAAALVYFIDPIDLVPDFIPVAGMVDDVSVLLWVLQGIRGDVRKFISWEENQSFAQ